MLHDLEPLELYLKNLYPTLPIELTPSSIYSNDKNNISFQFVENIYTKLFKHNPVTIGGLQYFAPDSSGSDLLCNNIDMGIFKMKYIIANHAKYDTLYVLVCSAENDMKFSQLYNRVKELKAFI